MPFPHAAPEHADRPCSRRQLCNGAAADNYFMSIGATREDEAVGSALSVGVGMRMFSFSARDCRSIAKN
jgi:hypothetical protein